MEKRGELSLDRDLPPLSREEILRYGRHLILPEVGMHGQRRLKQARVLLVGTGGLGSPAALYLAAAGVGTLGLVDFDTVDVTNLHRQILHGTKDVGRSKLLSASERIRDINPHVALELFDTALTSGNALDIAKEFDLIVDGTDNFPTRYLVNDTAVLLGKPNVYGSIFRFEGQASVFAAPGGPCYRCLFRDPPPPESIPNCAEAGVLGILPGIVGTIQATEAIKLILGLGDSLVGQLLLVDALRMRFRSITVQPDPTCPACGTHELQELIDYEAFCGVSGAPASDEGHTVALISVTDLARRLAQGDVIQLIDVRDPHEWDICHLPGARLIPLAVLDQSLETMDQRLETVLYCKTGVRSRRAATLLRKRGFTNPVNLVGGIAAWSREVDPTLPAY